MKNPLIIALDFEGRNETESFLNHFKDEQLFVKVGMELFYQEGPDILKMLKAQGHRIFLDLKLHDIPNTVNRAMKGLAKLECDLVNVHAAGGSEMMKAALEGLEEGTALGKNRPKCVAVTQLTSTTELQMKTEQGIGSSLQESVLHYAGIANFSGMDGVVCSALEARSLRDRFGADFLTVVPGIRMAEGDSQDQKRIATPQFARHALVSAIVVGRPITKSEDPNKSYQEFKQSWEGLIVCKD